MTTVLIVDDQDLIREGFRGLIEADAEMSVVGAAADGAEGVRLASELQPDVVVMDIRMPVMDGLEATRYIPQRPRAAENLCADSDHVPSR